MRARSQQVDENTSFLGRVFRRKPSANLGGINRAPVAQVSNPNTFRARLNRSIDRHPYLWGAAKWLALGAVSATVLYFSGGLAAIPFVAPAVAQLGATIIAVATPIIATAAAALWHGVAKPVGNFFRRLFSSRGAAQNASIALPVNPSALQLSPLPRSTPASLPGSRLATSPVLPSSSAQTSSIPTSSIPLPSGRPSIAPLVIDDENEQKGSISAPQALPTKALTLNGKEVDLSYMYDGLTIYPKGTGEITGLAACIEKCKQLEIMRQHYGPFMMMLDLESPRTRARNSKASDCMTLIKTTTGAQFKRPIYADADDHGLYHQDGFQRERSHYHLKFNRFITEAQFSSMIFIFASESLITAQQASDYIRAFSQRNAAARAALAAVCQPAENSASSASTSSAARKQVDLQAILRFISTCPNNDILVHLHDYLLEPQFDHLREITEMHPSKEWQGMDRSGNVVKTSKAWAQLEKGISLQMIKNIKEQASNFSSNLGRERSQQLADSHRFFGIKRTRSIAHPNAPRTFKTLDAFSEADEARLDRKYNKIFKHS